MTRAYILVVTAVGTIEPVQTTLREVPGIRAVDIVTGDYDLIAILEAPNIQDVGRLVMRDIHGVDGVERTHTCIVVG